MSDPVEIAELHHRYQIQASWTRELRRRVLHDVGGSETSSVLEVGSGTGIILGDVHRLLNARPVGLDIDPKASLFAASIDPQSDYLTGDGFALPFDDDAFDLSLCHFLLMWVQDPLRILSEMQRVTCPGGWVLALAEPDYEARLDHPPELIALGDAQRRSLEQRGVDPRVGRRLATYLHQAGFNEVTVGILGSEWRGAPPESDWASEWDTLHKDLEDAMPYPDLRRLQTIDREAWKQGTRVLFVPTFYGFARVP